MQKQSVILLPTRVWLLVGWLVWAASGAAHTLPISYLTLVPDEDYLHLSLTLNPFELMFYSELDARPGGGLDSREWAGDRISRRILDAVKVRVNGRLVTPDIAGLTPSYESHHITVRAHYAVDARRAAVSVESDLAGITSGGHLTQVTFGSGERTQAARLDTQAAQVSFEPAEGPAATLDLGTDPPGRTGRVGHHEVAVALWLTCLVSVLLLWIACLTLIMGRFLSLRSDAPFVEPAPATPPHPIR